VTPPHGCSTKWITHRDQVTADNEKWETGEVTVELIDAKAVASLRKNDTKKVRLFNVWATWCGPCVKEFPELVATSRKFGLRDFEFISISMDDPETLPEVKAFLEKYNVVVPNKLKPSLKAEGRKGNAYVFNEANSDALIQALDPEWPGPIPHTLVVAPGGEVIYRHNGLVDGDELRAKILEYMGRFYVPEEP
jgi:thiol-disulfide isomerase/thioredoxin